jgi:hypothetical protein
VTPALLVLALAVQGPDTAPAPRRCEVVIDHVGGYYVRVPVTATLNNEHAGGGVLARCRGTGSRLSADSVAWYPTVRRLDMVGNVRIRDTSFTLDSRTASYFTADERLEAYTGVVAVNRRSGSVLRGPNLVYLRAAAGIRDTTEMRATGRPTIEYRAEADTAAEPYIIVADRVRLRGNAQVWGGGRVTIDRSDFAARGDSFALDQGIGRGHLVGASPPSVMGKGARPYTLEGLRIDLGLAGRDIRRVEANGGGNARGEDWTLVADTIHLGIERQKLQQGFAWGGAVRPTATSAQQTIVADSIALDMPDEVLTEVRAFGRAVSSSKRDTTAAADIDWIAGDTVTARFDAVTDSAGRRRTEIRQVLARSSARALTHHYDEERRDAPPAINYSRGDGITVSMLRRRVHRVVVSGQGDGVHLEPQPPRPAPADTTTPAVVPR